MTKSATSLPYSDMCLMFKAQRYKNISYSEQDFFSVLGLIFAFYFDQSFLINVIVISHI